MIALTIALRPLMLLQFTITEEDAIAFAEMYLRNSQVHRRTRNRVRWGLPVIMALVAGYFTWKHGVRWEGLALFAAVAAIWAVLYPRRFDARIRSHLRRQMTESSHGKILGKYELELRDQELAVTGPLGAGSFSWSAVDRVMMDAEYAYIFLAGGTGYPIRIAEVGEVTARRVCDYVLARAAAG